MGDKESKKTTHSYASVGSKAGTVQGGNTNASNNNRPRIVLTLFPTGRNIKRASSSRDKYLSLHPHLKVLWHILRDKWMHTKFK